MAFDAKDSVGYVIPTDVIAYAKKVSKNVIAIVYEGEYGLHNICAVNLKYKTQRKRDKAFKRLVRAMKYE